MPTPYVTVEVLRQTFGPASIDATLETTDIDIAVLLDSVNAEVDGYVSGAVPLPPTPAAIVIVRGAAADIARYRLYRFASDEDMRKRFEDAVRFLERVAARKVPLPLPEPDPSIPGTEAGPVADYGSAPRQMQRSQLRGW